jgi:hypothetical protein
MQGWKAMLKVVFKRELKNLYAAPAKDFTIVDVPPMHYLMIDGLGDSYANEAPVLARLHHEFMPNHGLTFNGKHREICLSDARKTAPEKLKTIPRQPVRPVAASHG